MTKWHNKPQWAAAMFKEPIQGVKVGDGCSFPTYDEVAAKHGGLGLVMTIGESDAETCAGVMYFGDWAKELKKAEKDAEAGGGKADTVKLGRVAEFGNDGGRVRARARGLGL
jgi:hypothetical protein